MSADKYACPESVYEQFAWNMTVAHSVIKAGYESILKHLENPPSHDLNNFISYCLVWTKFVHGHHSVEDQYLFPIFTKHIDLTSEKEQHEHIHKGLDQVNAHLKEAQADNSKFDAGSLRQTMASFKDVLFAHLDEEIVDVGPDRLKVYSETELKVIMEGLEAEAKKEGGLSDVLPFIMTHMDQGYRPHWPAGLPGFLRNFIIPYLAIPYHKSWWKYSPHY